MERVLDKLSSNIDRTELRNAEADARDQFALEWKQVSLVIDRVLLLVFFFAMTISSFVILTSSPHLFASSVKDKAPAAVEAPVETQQEQPRVASEES